MNFTFSAMRSLRVLLSRRVATGVAVAFSGFTGSTIWWKVQAESKVDYKAVKSDIADLLDSNLEYDYGSYGPVLVRLAWHSSGT